MFSFYIVQITRMAQLLPSLKHQHVSWKDMKVQTKQDFLRSAYSPALPIIIAKMEFKTLLKTLELLCKTVCVCYGSFGLMQAFSLQCYPCFSGCMLVCLCNCSSCFRCCYCCWLVYIWETSCNSFLGQNGKTLGCRNSWACPSVNW